MIRSLSSLLFDAFIFSPILAVGMLLQFQMASVVIYFLCIAFYRFFMRSWYQQTLGDFWQGISYRGGKWQLFFNQTWAFSAAGIIGLLTFIWGIHLAPHVGLLLIFSIMLTQILLNIFFQRTGSCVYKCGIRHDVLHKPFQFITYLVFAVLCLVGFALTASKL